MLVKLILGALPKLPLRLLHWMGNVAGWFAWTFRPRERWLALRNLELCFPERTAAQRRRLARASFAHYYKQLFECPLVWAGDMDRVRRLTVGVQGLDKLDAALAQGKGVILAAMHAGSFEVGVIPMSERYTMWGMYKPFKWPLIDAMARHGRSRFGGRVEPIILRPGKRGISSQLLRALKRGGRMVLLKPPPTVEKVLVSTGVEEFMPIRHDRAEALAAFATA